MKKSSILTLNQLNQDFYNQVAVNFDDSRSYTWEGWNKLKPLVNRLLLQKSTITILDLGCGNGRFISWLDELLTKNAHNDTPNSSNPRVSYTGLDSNQFLLKKAKEQATKAKNNISCSFIQSDIVQNLIDSDTINSSLESYDLIVAFGVIHHIPGESTRHTFIRQISKLIKPQGYACIAAWDFTTIPSLMKRSQPLAESSIILDPEPQDYLLDWQRGSEAYRYCHFVSDQEMQALWSGTDLEIVLHYQADGPTQASNSYWIVQKK